MLRDFRCLHLRQGAEKRHFYTVPVKPRQHNFSYRAFLCCHNAIEGLLWPASLQNAAQKPSLRLQSDRFLHVSRIYPNWRYGKDSRQTGHSGGCLAQNAH